MKSKMFVSAPVAGVALFVFGAIVGSLCIFYLTAPPIKQICPTVQTPPAGNAVACSQEYDDLISKSFASGGSLVSALHELGISGYDPMSMDGLMQPKGMIIGRGGSVGIVPFGYLEDTKGFFAVQISGSSAYYLPNNVFFLKDTDISHRYIEDIAWKDANTIVYTQVTGAPGGVIKEKKEFHFVSGQCENCTE